MKLDVNKKIKQIAEHFNDLSVEQLEQNLLVAGIERIKPSGMQMVNVDEDLTKHTICKGEGQKYV